MKRERLKDVSTLERGDIVANRMSGLSYVVVGNVDHNGYVVAVRSITISNPVEWEVVKRSELH